MARYGRSTGRVIRPFGKLATTQQFIRTPGEIATTSELVARSTVQARRGIEYRSTILNTPNVLSYWRLDETSGPMLDQLAGRTSVSVTGTGIQRGQPGGIVMDADRCFLGDTATGAGNVRLPDLLLSTTDFTVEAWSWNTRTGDENNVYIYQMFTGIDGGHRIISRRTGAFIGIRLSGFEYQIQPSGLSSISLQWAHWVLTRSGATMTAYRNGVQIGTRSDLPSGGLSLFSAIDVGASTLGGAGGVDEYTVYTRALTQTEVTDHYRAGLKSGVLTTNNGEEVGPTDVASRQTTVTRGLSSDLAASVDTVVQSMLFKRLPTDAAASVDTSSRSFFIGTRATSDVGVGVDNTARQLVGIRTVLDSISISEASTRLFAGTRQPMDYRSTVMSTTNLIAYWRLDETGGTIKDEVGSFPGTIVGSPVLGATGLLTMDSNRGMKGATNAYIDATDNSSATLALNGSFTIEWWHKIDTLPASGVFPGVAQKGNSGITGAGGGWLLGYAQVSAGIIFKRDNVFANGDAYTLGAIEHRAITYDGVNVNHYKNGVLSAGPIARSYPSLTNNSSLKLLRADLGTWVIDGTIDEVAFYSRALIATELLDHYRAGIKTGVLATANGDRTVTSETTSRSTIAARTVADAITLSDSSSRTFVGTRARSDTAPATEASSRIFVGIRAVGQSVTPSDAVTRALVGARVNFDIAQGVDQATRIFVGTRVQNDTAPTSELAARSTIHNRSVIDFLTIAEVATRNGVFTRQLADSIPISDHPTQYRWLPRAISEWVNGTEVVARFFQATRTAADTAAATDVLTRLRFVQRALTELVGGTDVLTKQMTHRRFPTETVSGQDALVRHPMYQRFYSETVNGFDVVTRFYAGSRSFAESVPVSDATSRLQKHIRIFADTALASDGMTRRFTGTRATAENVHPSDSVAAKAAHFRNLAEALSTASSETHWTAYLRRPNDVVYATDVAARSNFIGARTLSDQAHATEALVISTVLAFRNLILTVATTARAFYYDYPVALASLDDEIVAIEQAPANVMTTTDEAMVLTNLEVPQVAVVTTTSESVLYVDQDDGTTTLYVQSTPEALEALVV